MYVEITILLLCETDARKMWGARIYNTGVVRVYWGRIPPGNAFTPATFFSSAAQIQEYSFPTGDSAIDFVNKKVKEKRSKGYEVAVSNHKGVDLSGLGGYTCDEYDRIVLRN